MSAPTIKLSEAAQINPRLNARPAADTFVSFLGMADVDAESGATSRGKERVFGEVSKGYTQFADGDLLVAKITPCFENGKIAQAGVNHPHGSGSTEFHVIRPDRLRFDARFLLRFLRQPYVRIAGERRMTGSGGQRRVPEAYLADLRVPLLPLEEQKRIALVLDSVDALCAKRRRVIALLGDLRQAIFLDMFGNPVSNPKGWPMVRLAELGSLDRGVSKHRPRNAPELLGGKYPLVQTGDVAASQGYVTEWKATYSDIGLAQSKLWPSGTLCITIAANIAKAGILKFNACFPDSVVGFSSTPDIVEYVQVWLSFHQEDLERLAPESAQKNINLGVLRGLDIPKPDSDLISSFVKRIRAINTLKVALRSHLTELDALFASLQHRAFRGELWADTPAA